MERKPCSLCSSPADFSLAFHLSTLAVRPRGQKCTQPVLLCNACMQNAIASLVATPLQQLQQPLTDAYTRFAQHSTSQAQSLSLSDFADEVHQGGTSEVSCRPRLIACNSRKFTHQSDGGE